MNICINYANQVKEANKTVELFRPAGSSYLVRLIISKHRHILFDYCFYLLLVML